MNQSPNFNRNSPHNFDAQHGGCPSFERGTPRSAPGPRGSSYRGAPGFFGTPYQTSFNRSQNSYSNYTGRGNNRGNRSRGTNNRHKYSFNSHQATGWSESGYFHSSMLEDPWTHLEDSKCNNDASEVASSHQNIHSQMSDSMIAQVIKVRLFL